MTDYLYVSDEDDFDIENINMEEEPDEYIEDDVEDDEPSELDFDHIRW